MKIVITERQYKRIFGKKSINEQWYNDLLNIAKSTGLGDKTKEFFKDVTGIDFDDKDDVDDVPDEKEVTKKIKKYISTKYMPGVDDKKKEKDTKKTVTSKEKKSEKIPTNIVIGDSQAPYIAKQSEESDLLSKKGSEESLWGGGKNLKWLTQAVSKYPQNKDVRNVIISIGTNGQFGNLYNDDVRSLVDSLEKTFPNAQYHVVKGSWGWGGNKNVNEKDVEEYYKKFSKFGVNVIPTAIGNVEPHGDLPVYIRIGKEIDKNIINY